MKRVGKLEWFGGNVDALNMFETIVRMLHIWDDLVDLDRPVSEKEVNSAFLSALVYLPANPFYRSIQDAVLPMWLTVVSAYEAANKWEREQDEFGLEIAHNLRFAVGHIVAYAIHCCVDEDTAREVIPEAWKYMVNERYEAYRKEHMNDSE